MFSLYSVYSYLKCYNSVISVYNVCDTVALSVEVWYKNKIFQLRENIDDFILNIVVEVRINF